MAGTITWKGKEITYGDWDSDRSGYLFIKASEVTWDGTRKGLKTCLIDYLENLPTCNPIGWPKETIESLRLSGNLTYDGKTKSITIFPTRSYGSTGDEKEYEKINIFNEHVYGDGGNVIDDFVEYLRRTPGNYMKDWGLDGIIDIERKPDGTFNLISHGNSNNNDKK